MDREAVNVNDKREGAEKTPGDVQRVVADLESADRKLTEHLAAHGESEGAAAIVEARSLLRAAIGTLKPPAPVDVGEEITSGKRRVKIKAESEVASASESAGTGPQAKSGAPVGKSAARGTRNHEGNRAGRRNASAEKVPNGSLLARLGAAGDAAASPPAEAGPPVMAEPAPPPKADTPVTATADRLAQLEAEIADLTEAVTTVHTAPAKAPTLRGNTRGNMGQPRATDHASAASQATSPASPEAQTPEAQADESDVGSDDEDDAEITIIGANGTPSEPTSHAARLAPRIFRGGPPLEEEAEVEIRGHGAAPSAGRSTEQAKSVRISTRTSAGTNTGKGGALGKWRLFRGSR